MIPRFFENSWLFQRSWVPRENRSSKGVPDKPHLFVRVDTTWLQRMQRALSPTEDEECVLVTGIKYSADQGRMVMVLTSPFMPRYDEQSIGGVAAQQQDVLTIQEAIAGNGQELLARMHSHPGPGIGMCTQSERDIVDQKRWESCGYEVVSAIFTRVLDGSFFVRFFTVDLPLTVQVFGAAKRREDHVFEIPAESL